MRKFAAFPLLKRHGRTGASGRPFLLFKVCPRSVIKLNSLSEGGEKESVGQFFHILGGVEQQRGLCEVSPGKYEITIYTSCINADKGIYYYTTYGNRQISAVNMHNQNLDGASLYRFAPISEEQIFMQN